MLLARLATKVAKPDGQFWVEPENVNDFVKDILVSDLPGGLFISISNILPFFLNNCFFLTFFEFT